MILWFFSSPPGANHAPSLIHSLFPEGKSFRIRNAFANLSFPRACLWPTTSLKQAMGNSSSMGKHRKAQRQHPTHHLHSWAGVTAAQSTQNTSAQQIGEIQRIPTAWSLLKQTNMKTRPATHSRAPEDQDSNPRPSCHHRTFCSLKPQAVPQGSRGHSFLPTALSHKGGYRNTATTKLPEDCFQIRAISEPRIIEDKATVVFDYVSARIPLQEALNLSPLTNYRTGL